MFQIGGLGSADEFYSIVIVVNIACHRTGDMALGLRILVFFQRTWFNS